MTTNNNSLPEKNPISMKFAVHVSLIWLIILLWYIIVAATSSSSHFFQRDAADYYLAAVSWIHGQPLYRHGFIYLPSAAAFLTPLTVFPIKIYAFIFRIISLLIFSIGLYQFCGFLSKSKPARTLLISVIVCTLMMQGPFFEGQMHIITTGLTMLGLVALVREKWWQCAIFFALSLALKQTSIVIFLLVLALYPKLSWRLLLITALMLVSIFLMQSSHYVFTQYVLFIHTFMHAMHADGHSPNKWATFFGALHQYTHISVYGAAQFGIRAIIALSVFATCWIIKARLSSREVMFFIFALGMCYLMLFNSRTENNDYIMITPAIAFSLAMAINSKKHWVTAAHVLMFFLMVINWNLSKIITPHSNIWLNPTIVLVFFIYIIQQIISKLRAASINQQEIGLGKSHHHYSNV